MRTDDPLSPEATHDDRTRRQPRSTRPISVAELLAKNGTIGAPPVGGRRRRRRGNTDAVTVAELTGEIPIITDGHPTSRRPQSRATTSTKRSATTTPGRCPVTESAEHVDEDTDAVEEDREAVDEAAPTDEEADYAAHIEQRDAEPLFVRAAVRGDRTSSTRTAHPASRGAAPSR